MIGYKLFKVKDGKLFPLYVYANEEVKIGEWIDAKEGELTCNGKVKSKLGELAYRPGLHITTLPIATHIGTKQPDGTLAQAKDTVWCEVEFSDNINYQAEAMNNGLNKKGEIIERNAYLKHIPTDGYYYYTTNPNAVVDWIIAGSMKVNKVLSNNEVSFICRSNGIEPQPLAS